MKKQDQANEKLSLDKTTITKLNTFEKKYILGGNKKEGNSKNSDHDGSITGVVTSGIECLLTNN